LDVRVRPPSGAPKEVVVSEANREERVERAAALEVIVMWGDSSVLEVKHLSPMRDYVMTRARLRLALRVAVRLGRRPAVARAAAATGASAAATSVCTARAAFATLHALAHQQEQVRVLVAHAHDDRAAAATVRAAREIGRAHV
jgi:hypothetical protein